MRINSGGSTDINLLQSDAAQFRNRDFVVNNLGAFAGWHQIGATAAEYQHVGLYNPVGSGITIFVDQLSAFGSVDSQIFIRFSATELTSFSATWRNKRANQAAGAGRLSNQSNAIQLGTTWIEFAVLASQSYTVSFASPFQLDAGQGIILQHDTVNRFLSAAFYGREV